MYMPMAAERRKEIMQVIVNSVKKATLQGKKVDKEKLINEVQRMYGSERRKVVEYLSVLFKSREIIEDAEGISYQIQEELREQEADAVLSREPIK